MRTNGSLAALAFLSVSTAALLGVCACSSSSSNSGSDAGADGSPGGDASAQNDASADSGSDVSTGDGSSGACNTIANETATISEEVIVGTPPTPIGGTIVDGLYFLTHVQTYVGDGGTGAGVAASHRAWQISGNTIQIVRRFAPFSVNNPDHHHTVSFQASGTSFTGTFACTDPLDPYTFGFDSYSVNGNDFVGFGSNAGMTTATTFTKQ
jgi:hypothetical protein